MPKVPKGGRRIAEREIDRGDDGSPPAPTPGRVPYPCLESGGFSRDVSGFGKATDITQSSRQAVTGLDGQRREDEVLREVPGLPVLRFGLLDAGQRTQREARPDERCNVRLVTESLCQLQDRPAQEDYLVRAVLLQCGITGDDERRQAGPSTLFREASDASGGHGQRAGAGERSRGSHAAGGGFVIEPELDLGLQRVQLDRDPGVRRK